MWKRAIAFQTLHDSTAITPCCLSWKRSLRVTERDRIVEILGNESRL
ncbi:MAG TPA: hypothetical protein V6D14_28675 [Coleofasciculaceae cyanobacterium]